MSAVINDRDIALGAATSRYGNQGAGILLTSSANVYQVASDGTVTPANATFTATQLGNVDLPVTWSVSPTVPLVGTGNNTRTLDLSNVKNVASVGITASVTVNGQTYNSTFTLTKVINARSPGHFYILASNWDDTAAANACPGGPIAGDVVTFYNNNMFADERIWDGTAWQYQGLVIDGNLLVKATITAGALNVGYLDAITARIGLLRTASTGGRVEIKDNLIEVFDSSNAVRVKIGDQTLS